MAASNPCWRKSTGSIDVDTRIRDVGILPHERGQVMEQPQCRGRRQNTDRKVFLRAERLSGRLLDLVERVRRRGEVGLAERRQFYAPGKATEQRLVEKNFQTA